VAVVERLSLWGDRGCNMTPVFFVCVVFCFVFGGVSENAYFSIYKSACINKTKT